MSISMRKYVDITSGVGGGATVRRRELIGRLFTTNNLAPTNTLLEFTEASEVADYFGISSEEYARALHYFGFISKQIRRANKISFVRWASANAVPRIFGRKGQQSFNNYTSITSGAFTITVGGVSVNLTGLNFSSALSLADVASVIQTAVRLSVEPQFSAATVLWDATRQSFNFVGTYNGSESISVSAGVSNDVAGALGWLDATTIFSDGAPLQTVTEALSTSEEANNNFGSILFIPDLTLDQYEDIGAWNTAQNVSYMVMVPVSPANDQTWSDALRGYWGIALTVSPLSNEFPEQIPMEILAATDYTKRAASQNYMFQMAAGVTPSATTTSMSDRYDNLRLNYYGRTQTAGQIIEFYQRGVLTGEGMAPVDMNVYANEMWLRDEASAQLMELLLGLTRISANEQGRSEVSGALQSVADLGLLNGSISVGKPLTTQQKLYVGQVTGDDLAWHQVQNIGYWFDVVITPYETPDGRTEWKAVYTFVFAKDDAIRKIDGTHVLI